MLTQEYLTNKVATSERGLFDEFWRWLSTEAQETCYKIALGLRVGPDKLTAISAIEQLGILHRTYESFEFCSAFQAFVLNKWKVSNQRMFQTLWAQLSPMDHVCCYRIALGKRLRGKDLSSLARIRATGALLESNGKPHFIPPFREFVLVKMREEPHMPLKAIMIIALLILGVLALGFFLTPTFVHMELVESKEKIIYPYRLVYSTDGIEWGNLTLHSYSLLPIGVKISGQITNEKDQVIFKLQSEKNKTIYLSLGEKENISIRLVKDKGLDTCPPAWEPSRGQLNLTAQFKVFGLPLPVRRVIPKQEGGIEQLYPIIKAKGAWSKKFPKEFSAFINPKNPLVGQFLKDFKSIYNATLWEDEVRTFLDMEALPEYLKTIAMFLAVFYALQNEDIRYSDVNWGDLAHPEHENIIKTPEHLFIDKRGNCADFTVLVASILEHLKPNSTCYVASSQHVFVLFDTGASTEELIKAGVSPSYLVDYKDPDWPGGVSKIPPSFVNAWMPIEAANIGKKIRKVFTWHGSKKESLVQFSFYVTHDQKWGSDKVSWNPNWLQPSPHLTVSWAFLKPETQEEIKKCVKEELTSLMPKKASSGKEDHE